MSRGDWFRVVVVIAVVIAALLYVHADLARDLRDRVGR